MEVELHPEALVLDVDEAESVAAEHMHVAAGQALKVGVRISSISYGDNV